MVITILKFTLKKWINLLEDVFNSDLIQIEKISKIQNYEQKLYVYYIYFFNKCRILCLTKSI